MRFIFKLRDLDSIDELLQELYKRLPVPETKVRIKGNKVELDLRGVPRRSGQIKAVVEQVLGSQESQRLYRFSYKVSSPVPPDVIAEVLKHMSYRSEASSEGVLLSNAPQEVFNRAWEALKRAMSEEVPGLRLSSSVRRTVAAASALTGLHVKELVSLGISAGLFSIEDKRVTCSRPWREALRELRRQVGLVRGVAEDNAYEA